jgi:(2Fe-2S) ferredoxin/predicted RNA-binding protein with PIN domain
MHAVVDGHNVIGRLGLAASDRESERRAVLRRVLDVTADATVFFDARGAPAAAPTITREGGLDVRFCRARDADEDIVAFVREAKRPEMLVVVTDDRELARRSRQLGAKTSAVAAFFASTQRGQTPLSRSATGTTPDVAGGGGSGGGGPRMTAADFGLPATVDLSRPGDWFNVGDPLLSNRQPSKAPSHAPSAPPPAPPAVEAPRFGPEAEAKARALAATIAASRPARHVFLCAEATKPKCAPAEIGRPVWEHLKQRVKELGLDAVKPHEGLVPGQCILRTKADCLRICNDGPIAVVYPDGVWYRGVTVPVMERILIEHVLGGRPVESHVLTRVPLAPWSQRLVGGT